MASRTAPPAPTPPAKRAPWWVQVARSGRSIAAEARGQAPGPGRLVLAPDGTVEFRAPHRKVWPRLAAICGTWSWRNRRTLAPLPIAAAYTILNAYTITGPDTARWTVVAALVAAVFAASAWLAMLGGQDRTGPTLAIAALTIASLTAWWLTPAPPGGAFAIAGAAAAASAVRFRIRQENPMPATDPRAWQVQRWEEVVAAPGGPLPGTTATFLGDVHAPPDPDQPDAPPTPIGFTLGVELVPGRHEVATVHGKRGLLAGVYRAERAGTVIDETGSEVAVTITFTTRAFLAEVRDWRNPTLDTARGRFVMQTLADGSHGYWVFWVPGQGVKHGWVVGATGSGKTGALDVILSELLSAGLAVADLVDLKGGASLPHWKHRTLHYGTTPEKGVRALRRGVLLCDYRNAVMARLPYADPDTGEPVHIDGRPVLGRTWIDPTPDWPIYAIPFEEWPVAAKDPKWGGLALFFADRIAKLGRQALVMIIFTSQGANLSEVFGESRVIRSNVQAGNVLVLWTDQGSGNLATANRTIDLSRIPAGQPGVSYLAGPGQTRDVQGRVPYQRRPTDAVQAARPATLTPREAAVLDAADAISDGLPLHEVRAATIALYPDDPEWREIINLILEGDDAKADTTTPPPATAGPGDVTWTGGVLGDPLPPPRTAGQATILAVLARGEGTAAQLRAALGDVTDQALRHHLAPLLDEGAVTQPARGRYTLPTPTTDPQE